MTLRVGIRISTARIDAKIARLKAAHEIAEKYAAMAVELARGYVRVDTGELRDSIESEVVETLKSFIIRVSAGKGIKDERAPANEFGTSVMAAQPYIRPALEQIRGPFLAELRELMK